MRTNLVLRRVVIGILAIAMVGTVLVAAVSATSGVISISNGITATVGTIVTCAVGGLAIMIAVIRRTKRTNHKIFNRHSVSRFSHIGIARTALILSSFIYGNNTTTHKSQKRFDRAAI